MNRARRKEVAQLIELVTKLKEDLEILQSTAWDLQNDEQAAFDNLPDALQVADRGMAMEESASHLDTAHGAIESAVESLQEALDELEQSKGA